MKKQGIIVSLLILTLSLSACATQPRSSDTGTPNNGDNSSKTVEPSTTPTGNTTEDFLKTITLETAEEKGVCGADLIWYYKDNVLVIKGTGDMMNWYQDATPAMPWHAAGIANQIIHVYIEDGVTSIGDHAFSYWFLDYQSAIAKVVIGKDIKLIGDSAFNGAKNIEFEFKGDAPEGIEAITQNAKAIKYSGSSFDSYVEDYPEIEWIKQ